MNRSLILLLAASASAAACAHDRPAHHRTSTAHASARARQDATTDDYAEQRALDDAPRRANRAENASADGYVSPSEERATERERDRDSADPVFGSTTAPDEAYPADNTAQNKADSDGDTLTAADQGNSEADRKTTQDIRKAVMAHDALSFNAKNVKIITREGHVTLRGPVNHQKEKLAIQEIASRIAGAEHVDNQLQVK